MPVTIKKELPRISELPPWAKNHEYCKELYGMYLNSLTDRIAIDRAEKTPAFRKDLIQRIEKEFEK